MLKKPEPEDRIKPTMAVVVNEIHRQILRLGRLKGGELRYQRTGHVMLRVTGEINLDALEAAIDVRIREIEKDRDGWKREAEMFRNAWVRETNGFPRRGKAHLIDELVLVTERMREAALKWLAHRRQQEAQEAAEAEFEQADVDAHAGHS